MTNVHLQTAATNIRRASNDFKISMDKIQADANQQKRELEKRIDELKREQAVLDAKARSPQDPGSAEALIMSRKLAQEISQLEKTIFNIQDQARKQIDQLNHQMNDFNNLASRIESAA
jgi:methyl-accepting chemotaxis protein